jgi:hypothetical protein
MGSPQATEPGRGAEPRLSNDPRVGLKPGFKDAGEAIKNLERIASLPKPDGFFDPKARAGTPIPPERPPNETGGSATAESNGDEATTTTEKPDDAPAARAAGAGQASSGREGAGAGHTGAAASTDNPSTSSSSSSQRRFDPVAANRPSYTNSDMAFSRNRLFVGNYHGFNVYDIERAARPRLLASVVCPGGQGDVSVYGNLLFLSVEQTRGRLDCGTSGVQTAVSAERFRGVRIFDITEVARPRQLAAVQTCRGSHTHTIVPDPRDSSRIYVYGSGTSAVRSGDELTGCSNREPQDDPNTALFSIDVIEVPLAAPGDARIVSRPRIFADAKTGDIAGLWKGGNHGDGTQTSRSTNQCHDITVFAEIGLAAGACAGNGILLDIRDPRNPVRVDQVVDKGFAYWHSATFNNDGTKIVFTDEWGGGGRPRCREKDPLTWGANGIFDIVDRKLRFGGYFKMPAPQTEQENCVAHNGSLIPVPGRDIMVQAWYQGGISVFDFTDSARPVEIAYFDRGPLDAKQLYLAGYWSAYWYNGAIYASEIARGIDIFRLKPSEHLSQNEINAAMQVWSDELNTQQQSRTTWPAHSSVAGAYLDQLVRSQALDPDRAQAIRTAVQRAEGLRTGREPSAAAALDALATFAASLERDAAGATGRDVVRFRQAAQTIRAIGARVGGRAN